MGDPIDSSYINDDLIGRRISMYSPYFPSDKCYRCGIVRYVEASSDATKVVLEEEDSGLLELLDFNSYRNVEIED